MRHPLLVGLLRLVLLALLPLLAVPASAVHPVWASLVGDALPGATAGTTDGPTDGPTEGAATSPSEPDGQDRWAPAGDRQPAQTRLTPTDRPSDAAPDGGAPRPVAAPFPAPVAATGPTDPERQRPAGRGVPGTPDGRAPPVQDTAPCPCT